METSIFWQFIWDNLDAAGVIGGYVSISIIAVGVITFFSNKGLKQTSHIIPSWGQPFLGAFLGVIPGCGGTIVASSLYKNKKITFGGLLAAFITTLGEGSFVLLGASAEADVASNLKAFVVVNVVGAIIGITFGLLVDFLGVKKQFISTNFSTSMVTNSQSNNNVFAKYFTEKIGFFIILIIAIFLAPGSVMALWGGSINLIGDITILSCVVLTITSVIYYLTHRFILNRDCHNDNHSSIRNVLHDAITDISMVITYVFVGLIVANFIIDIIVGPEKFNDWMSSSKVIVVIISALIGATPGCGGMIAVAVAFITLPNFPLAALIAASIATSGDGIFPLFAENKKEAIVITGYSIIIALVVGFGTLGLGF